MEARFDGGVASCAPDSESLMIEPNAGGLVFTDLAGPSFQDQHCVLLQHVLLWIVFKCVTRRAFRSMAA